MSNEDWQEKLNDALRRFESKMDSGFDRLEKQIEKIESDHRETREDQIKAGRDVYHLDKDFKEFKKEYGEDKNKIYAIMREEIKKGVKESISGAKIFVYSLLGVILTVLIGLVSKIK